MKIRPYAHDDLSDLARLFTDTIHAVNRGDYTPAQVDAWAPRPPDLARWRAKLAQETVIVAELAGALIGFCAWDESGCLDFLFVHPAHQRKGIAAALHSVTELSLRAKGLGRIQTQASITAQPFFLNRGYRLLTHQTVTVRGVELANAVMEKILR